MKSTIILDKISQVSLYLLVVLIPLWFLPITQNVLEYQKQTLLAVLVLGGILSWLAKMIYEGELRVRLTRLHVPVFGVLAAMGISTLFSGWKYGSFWGWPADVTDNVVTFFAFALLFLLISQSVRDARQLFFLLGGLVIFGTLAVVFALVQAKAIFLLPFGFAQSPAFNTVGTTNGVAIFAALLLPLALMLEGKQKAWKGVLGGAAFILFGSLVLLDFFVAWLVALAGLIVLLAFDIVRQRQQPRAGRISLPMLFVLVALFFVIVGDVAIPGAPARPLEALPTYRGEWAIVQGVVGESPLYVVLGTGPGTFAADYAKYHLPEVNRTLFWNTRFDSGAAELLDWFITKGLLGLIALGGVVGMALVFCVRKLLQAPEQTADYALMIGLVASFIGVVASMFLYPANFMVWFVFWILLGGIAFFVGKEKRISLQEGPSFLSLGASFGFMAVVVLGLALVFAGGKQYVAQAEYAQGLKAQNEGKQEIALQKIESAARHNPSADIYSRNLAQLYLAEANRIAGDRTLQRDVRIEQTRAAINLAIEAAQKASKASPNNVANWNVQGFVYRNLIGVPDAELLAMESYERAKELEPASPFSWTELARVKILSSQARGENRLDEAISDLKRAIELKPDYAPAHYLLAVAYEEQDKQPEAVASLEEAKFQAPNDVGLAFQLGVLYYRQNELGKARDEFERAKSVNARYANARYMLGLVYDRLGRRADAIAEFAAVSALNPENQEVQDILANLAIGLPALSGIGQTSQPPIQDTPEEIEPE